MINKLHLLRDRYEFECQQKIFFDDAFYDFFCATDVPHIPASGAQQ